MPSTGQGASAHDWWRTAAIYEVYVRSFADGNGDGVGDLAGVRARLPYLAELGIDAIWFAPWYPSPMADAGYDVADYRAIEPLFGSLAEAEKLITEAHDLGIRIIIDVVPNHGSDQQPWFARALAAPPGSAERSRYHFRPGRGPGGELPPNDWTSMFGGPAWTRTPSASPRLAPQLGSGRTGHRASGTCTCSRPASPTSTGRTRTCGPSSPACCGSGSTAGWTASASTRPRCWPRTPGWPTWARPPRPGSSAPVGASAGWPGRAAWTARRPHPFIDRDEVHGIYQEWRRIADSYPGDRVLIGEVWLPDHSGWPATCARTSCTRVQLRLPVLRLGRGRAARGHRHHAGRARPGRRHADLGAQQPRRGPARNPLRPGRHRVQHDRPADRRAVRPALGTRRARAAALLTFSLPGGVYLYQGDELGLPEVEDLPEELLQDPIWERSRHTNRGRDGCRVPLPWSGDAPPFGFGPDGQRAVAAPARGVEEPDRRGPGGRPWLHA